MSGRRLVIAVVAALATGCSTLRHPVLADGELTARPAAAAVAAAPTGSIFQAAAYRPLFEDRKPRYVGDLLTVAINEKLNASQKANSSSERKSEMDIGLPGVKGIFGRRINPLDAKASTANSFDGKGATESSNLFTGTIAVTVLEVLANGNLRVGGDKQIGVRHNSEVLRFSGVIDPSQIQPGNVVSSTQVADARLDYRGGGAIEQAQIQGWLARFFNVVSPF